MLMTRQFLTHAPTFELPIDPPAERQPKTVRFGTYCDEKYEAICNAGTGGPKNASSVVLGIEWGEHVYALMKLIDPDGNVTCPQLAGELTKLRQSIVDHAWRNGVTIRDWAPSDYLRDGLLS